MHKFLNHCDIFVVQFLKELKRQLKSYIFYFLIVKTDSNFLVHFDRQFNFKLADTTVIAKSATHFIYAMLSKLS